MFMTFFFFPLLHLLLPIKTLVTHGYFSKQSIRCQTVLFGYTTRKIDVGDAHSPNVDLITRSKLLTREQELFLFNQVKLKNLIIARRNMIDLELSKSLNISLNKVVRKVDHMIRQGDEAEKILVEANVGLVFSMAKKCIYFGLPFPDLIHEGTFGLMKAIGKFQPERGCRLSTYATWWIKCSMQRAIYRHSRLIRIPSHIHELSLSIRQVNKQFLRELGRTASVEEISEVLCLPVAQVASITRAAFVSIDSMEEPGLQGAKDLDILNGKKRHQLVSSDKQPTDTFDLKQNEFFDQIKNVLTEEEATILMLRYGLVPNTKPLTFQNINKSYKYSQHECKLIETRAKLKIRKHYVRSDNGIC